MQQVKQVNPNSRMYKAGYITRQIIIFCFVYIPLIVGLVASLYYVLQFILFITNHVLPWIMPDTFAQGWTKPFMQYLPGAFHPSGESFFVCFGKFLFWVVTIIPFLYSLVYLFEITRKQQKEQEVSSKYAGLPGVFVGYNTYVDEETEEEYTEPYYYIVKDERNYAQIGWSYLYVAFLIFFIYCWWNTGLLVFVWNIFGWVVGIAVVLCFLAALGGHKPDYEIVEVLVKRR